MSNVFDLDFDVATPNEVLWFLDARRCWVCDHKLIGDAFSIKIDGQYSHMANCEYASSHYELSVVWNDPKYLQLEFERITLFHLGNDTECSITVPYLTTSSFIKDKVFIVIDDYQERLSIDASNFDFTAPLDLKKIANTINKIRLLQ